MDKKVTGIVGYIGWIGWIIAYVAGDQEGAKFHLNQSLVLNVASSIGGALIGAVTAVFSWIPVLGAILGTVCGILGGVWGLASLILMVLGIVNAANDQDTPLPLIGGIVLLK